MISGPIRLFSAAMGVAFASIAHAGQSAPITTPHATVTLVADVATVEPGKPFKLALHFTLAPGWHIYWVNPGVAGEPPQLDLTLPAGAKASEIAWPTPERVAEGPAMTYSYFDDVLLPLTVTPPAGISSFPIKAKASWLICQKICVPEQGDLSLDLPIGAASPSGEAALFTAAEAHIPRPSPYVSRISSNDVLTVSGDGLSLQSVREAWFLPAAWGAIDDLAPQTLTVASGKLSLALKPGETFDPKATLAGVLVIKDAAGGERDLSIAAAPLSGGAAPADPEPRQSEAAAGSHPAGNLGLLSALAFAFLGGLILNLMPCVFPILAMKAINIAGLTGSQRGTVRLHAVSYTLGVLVAFTALAGVLIALRAGGGAAGWGFQFQSPVFVAATAWLLFAIGLNLSGVFEIGGRLAGAGEGLTRLRGLSGSFFTGLLAVIVATPCTAPFMGVAIAAAAIAPSVTAFLIFLVMGLGLAAPYGLLALAPGLAQALPRPGRWMLIFRQALAFPMYAAAVWLVWVLGQQSDPDGVVIVLSGAVLIGFAGWILGATRNNHKRGRLIGEALAAAAALAVLPGLAAVAVAPPRSIGTSAAESPTAYSASRLADLRAEGRPVFVNMTAAWCVTCLVNERVALSSEAVKEAFEKQNVAYLKGDWTQADPAISQFLREHGREGVPLYVLYPPHGEAPVVLPQILTENAVLDELKRMGG
jgi:thiol:disulfide interchange protein/DsbC/DsbD-like thiol-disulfide interchange protein